LDKDLSNDNILSKLEVTENSSPINHQWQAAKDIVAMIVNIPSVLPSGVRMLAQDNKSSSVAVSDTSRSFLQLFTRSESIKTALYLSSKVFCPEQHALTEVKVDSKWFLNFYSTFDIAVTASLVVLFRRITKGMTEDEKMDLSPYIHRNAEIGGLVGRSIPDIGIGRGMLATTLPHLALGVFMKLDRSLWKQYQRALKLKKLHFDFEMEQEFWGCNHLQIASALIQSIGLGIDRAHAIGHASTVNSEEENSLTGELRRFYFAVLWTRCLIDTGKAPNRELPAEFYPLATYSELLFNGSETIRTMGSRYAWLEKETANYIDKEKGTHIIETEDPVEISQELLNALLSEE